MAKKSPYLRTDMAAECCADLDLERGIRGIRFKEYEERGIGISRLEITDREGEQIIGKPIGTYITMNVGKIWLADAETFERVAEALAEELKSMIRQLCPSPECILIAGLGNRYITSDAIGPLAIKNITVTRHIKDLDPPLFEKLSSLPIAAIAPGVIGQTGIETVEIIRGAAESISPSLLVAIDALAAKSVERLAVTVQLSDSGIAPGSGIGNRRKAISRETLGIPVISIGVPTVVDSSTLIYDMFERAGIEDIPDAIKAELENGKSFFVTLKDTDTASAELSRLIAHAINLAFSTEV